MRGILRGLWLGSVAVGSVTCADTQSPEPIAVLNVSTTSIAFAGVELGINPGAREIQISNGGGGSLLWSVSDNAPWLTLSPESGSGSGTVSAIAGLVGLTPGDYSATITIAAIGADNSPVTVPVTLTVDPAPEIALSPTSLTQAFAIGDTSPSRVVQLSNSGGGTLDWNTAVTSGRVSAFPPGGSGNAPLTIRFNTAGLAAGTFADTVTVQALRAKNSPQRIPTSLIVSPSFLSASPLSITIAAVEGAASRDTVLELTTNRSSLRWLATSSAPWLRVAPDSGTARSFFLNRTTLSIDPTGLTSFGSVPRTYNGTISITTSDAGLDATISVNLEIQPPPSIALQPSSLFFQGREGATSPASQSVAVTNGSGGTAITWSAAASMPWLNVTASGSLTPGTLTAAVNTTGLTSASPTDPALFRDTIVVASSAAVNTPQRVPVLLQIDPKPLLAVTDTPFTLLATAGHSTPVADTVTVRNLTGGTLDWTAVTDAPWLTLQPTSGTGTTQVVGIVNASTLAAGSYEGTVTFTAPGANGSPASARALLTVAPLYDGTWAGRTAPVDTTITLTISNNAITAISFGWGGISACGGTVSGHTSTTLGTPIAVGSGSFTRGVSGNPLSYTIAGTFQSATSATGTIQYSFSAACGSGSRTVTWSATRQ